ncbi:hypothetical protein C8R45DRAFT_946544 [Mycena sanguinolenta]|nr:hypothetical protein C8R45DRAFT_946544 [Mycena sanguinolenta]
MTSSKYGLLCFNDDNWGNSAAELLLELGNPNFRGNVIVFNLMQVNDNSELEDSLISLRINSRYLPSVNSLGSLGDSWSRFALTAAAWRGSVRPRAADPVALSESGWHLGTQINWCDRIAVSTAFRLAPLDHNIVCRVIAIDRKLIVDRPCGGKFETQRRAAKVACKWLNEGRSNEQHDNNESKDETDKPVQPSEKGSKNHPGGPRSPRYELYTIQIKKLNKLQRKDLRCNATEQKEEKVSVTGFIWRTVQVPPFESWGKSDTVVAQQLKQMRKDELPPPTTKDRKDVQGEQDLCEMRRQRLPSGNLQMEHGGEAVDTLTLFQYPDPLQKDCGQPTCRKSIQHPRDNLPRRSREVPLTPPTEMVSRLLGIDTIDLRLASARSQVVVKIANDRKSNID